MASHDWAQFTVGRIKAYAAVGIVENAVASCNAEVSPAAVRGLLAGSIMMVTGLGSLWGAGTSQAYATTLTAKGWMVSVSMQFIPAFLLLALVPFTPESPRWLVSKGRKEKAKVSLDRLRHKFDVQNGVTTAELDALEQIVEDVQYQASCIWLDLFRGTHLRRTWICATLFVLEQTSGNQFVQSYTATFFVQQGLGANSSTYSVFFQVVGVIDCPVGIVLFDISGRRPLMIGGSIMCTLLLYDASGLGLKKDLGQSGSNMILAPFILLPAFTRISASNTAFLTGAEIGGVLMGKKTMAFGTACDVLDAFIVTSVTPYLLPSMGVNIGWIFGSVAAFSVVWLYLFFPKTKGRSLEEVDEMFDSGLSARKFKDCETRGTARLLTEMENHREITKKGAVLETEIIERFKEGK